MEDVSRTHGAAYTVQKYDSSCVYGIFSSPHLTKDLGSSWLSHTQKSKSVTTWYNIRKHLIEPSHKKYMVVITLGVAGPDPRG